VTCVLSSFLLHFSLPLTALSLHKRLSGALPDMVNTDCFLFFVTSDCSPVFPPSPFLSPAALAAPGHVQINLALLLVRHRVLVAIEHVNRLGPPS
jgi:hypothetical protein